MYRYITLLAFLLLLAAATTTHKAEAKYPPVVKMGSNGAAITDLQFRLHTLGYLKVAPTAHFGHLTHRALQRFQKDHGLRSTGVANLSTWKKLKRRSLSRQEVIMLARVIYGEARGEAFKGQVAVGAVVLNRLQSPKFPKTLKGVVMQRNAFTAVQDGQFHLKPNLSAFKAAKAAVKGWDPSGNALFYYNPSISNSKWFKQRTTTKRIGNHLFTI